MSEWKKRSDIRHQVMASSKTLMLVVVLVSLKLTSAGRRTCKMDGETKACVEVVGRRGALKGVSLCQEKGGTCMALQKGGRTVTTLPVECDMAQP
ncbi:hypothetical protein MAR_027904 [Mya arenaria]|uniref:Uncharacterized protein n=1 Tax=Mya arenaria TaxID=6604 RepID=A0ABY7DD43_MYAAR|nr:hypothetical protein MAR_027904 [Mya arenaria]